MILIGSVVSALHSNIFMFQLHSYLVELSDVFHPQRIHVFSSSIWHSEEWYQTDLMRKQQTIRGKGKCYTDAKVISWQKVCGFYLRFFSCCLDVLCVHTQVLAAAEPPWTEARAAPHQAQSAPKAPLQGTAESSTKLAAPCRKQISAWAQQTQVEERLWVRKGQQKGLRPNEEEGTKGPRPAVGIHLQLLCFSLTMVIEKIVFRESTAH